MSLNRFFQDLATTVAGGAERRFARDLARTVGFRVAEPDGTTTRAKRLTGPGATPAPTPAPAPEPKDTAAFDAGYAAGKSWGFNHAFRNDLERVAQWASSGVLFFGRDFATVIFSRPSERAEADQLAAAGQDYQAGFLAGVLYVHQYQQAKE